MNYRMGLFMLGALFTAGPVTASEESWARSEIALLRTAYLTYLAAPPGKLPDSYLAEQKPLSTRYPVQGEGFRPLPQFEFFRLVDPFTGAGSTPPAQRQEAAARDLGSLEAFLAMNTFLEEYNQGKDARKLLLQTQKAMLTWAEKASADNFKPLERRRLSQAFAFMVSEIGQRPELLQLAPAYRSRRVFALETADSAREEALRIATLIKEISKP